MTNNIAELAKMALLARQNAYAPYSGYAVGAAVLTDDGRVFSGCNVENASYGASNCAERTAVFKAVSEGAKKIVMAAVAGAPQGNASPLPSFAPPCGICRQVLSEFGDEHLAIVFVKSETEFETHTLGELLPHNFGANNL